MTTNTTGLGQPVFLNYAQAELDAVYDQRVWAKDREAALQRRRMRSEAARQNIGQPLRLSYGSGEHEWLDLFQVSARSAPTLVFVHGGAWRAGRAKDHAFVAPLFKYAGAHCVILDFANVQDVDGNLMVLFDQVQRAVVWVYRNITRFGGDPSRIYLAGHSSGAHLAACTLLADWTRHEIPANIVRGALCISGLYDLRGARLSARSSYVRFTDEIEQVLSPIRHVGRIPCPVMVAYGTNESPEFMRMGGEFAVSLADRGQLGGLIVAECEDHFETLEALSEPNSLLASLGLKMMSST